MVLLRHSGNLNLKKMHRFKPFFCMFFGILTIYFVYVHFFLPFFCKNNLMNAAIAITQLNRFENPFNYFRPKKTC